MTTGRDWFQTEILDPDEEQDVSTCDMRAFVRNELEALSAGLVGNSLLFEEPQTFGKAAMELSAILDALTTIRAARDKMNGKGKWKL